ncbi:DeoR/GlpR family DNA-binding transcription regulator, partial [Weissella confusa]
MMISERHDKILALLNKRGRISIQELQQLMLVSVSTLRRDLDQLAESGEVQRIHGGVELTKQQQTLQHEALLSQKNEMNLSAKQVIARTAMRELHGGETIYLDAGSTTGAMIALLGNLQPAPQVVTNSVHHASQLADLMVPV